MATPDLAALRALLAKPRGEMTVNELYEAVGHLHPLLVERDLLAGDLVTARCQVADLMAIANGAADALKIYEERDRAEGRPVPDALRAQTTGGRRG